MKKKKFNRNHIILLVFALVCVGVGSLVLSLFDEKEAIDTKPSLGQMRTICDLAVMEAYYHNVAKYFEKDASGMLLWKKDKNFWVEYSGVVRVGVDLSLVDMTIAGNKVKITLPEAKVLGSRVDESSLTPESFIVAKKSSTVDASDQIYALAEAQIEMEQLANRDTVLLANAQQRAKTLLTDYVNSLGTLTQANYEIEWDYVDASGNKMKNA